MFTLGFKRLSRVWLCCYDTKNINLRFQRENIYHLFRFGMMKVKMDVQSTGWVGKWLHWGSKKLTPIVLQKKNNRNKILLNISPLKEMPQLKFASTNFVLSILLFPRVPEKTSSKTISDFVFSLTFSSLDSIVLRVIWPT